MQNTNTIVVVRLTKSNCPAAPLPGAFYYQANGAPGTGWTGPFPSEGKARQAADLGQGVLHSIETEWERKAREKQERTERKALPASIDSNGPCTALVQSTRRAIANQVASGEVRVKGNSPRNIMRTVAKTLLKMSNDILDVTEDRQNDSRRVKVQSRKTWECFNANEATSIMNLLRMALESEDDGIPIDLDGVDAPDLRDAIVLAS